MTDEEMAKAILTKRAELQTLIDEAESENGIQVEIEWDGNTLDITPFKKWVR